MKRLFAILLIGSLAACHAGFAPRGDTKDAGAKKLDNEEVLPSVAPPPSLLRKGVTLVCWYPGCFQEEEVEAKLDFLASLGVRWLAIVPTWYQLTIHTSEIFADPEHSATDEELRWIIGQAQDRGFQILLKPHLSVLSQDFWRGEIDPWDRLPWEQSYRNYILHFAQMAEELGVEIFSVGTELAAMERHTHFWIRVIDQVRVVYQGGLTYAANWDSFASVGFWDRLDFIGIDFYYPLTDNPDAAPAELESRLEAIAGELETYSAEQGRPILFTEIGYRSIDGAVTRPYDSDREAPIDLQEQADAYRAVLNVFSERDWLEGIFWWREDPRLLGGPDDDHYYFYGKPAAEVLREFWAE